eukprot:jgi/Ulvmu1/12767/UM096_0009.1
MRKPSLSIDTTVHEVKGRSPRVSLDPAEIIPRLYIGSLNVAKNAALLDKLGVSGVINASKAYYTLPASIQRLEVAVDDSPGVRIDDRLHECCEFITKHLQAGSAVLVHCRGGISRSATIVIAYLIKAGGKSSLREAYTHACTQKPNIMPNTGFFKQLLAWEVEVVGAPSMTMGEYYKVMLLDYGFSRAEVDKVVDSDDTGDFHTIIDRLHARHGLFVGGGDPSGAEAALAGSPDGSGGHEADDEGPSEGTPETTPGGSSAVQTPM